MSRRLRLIETETQPGAEKPLRVAIATNDLENLNAHFGSAKKFAIYDVTSNSASFVEAVAFDDVTAQSGKHDDIDDKITPKVDALEGCALLFALAIGGPSAAKVVKAGVHPIKRKAPEPISAVLEQVQTMLQGTPPPFLRKILGRDEKPSFMDDDYESEGCAQ
ncbi:nitrogen fixation protein NifX [Tropicimonas marinistellae]|uniref:nitrogen fixation protein NifX n=1 Tax=Tropicimonas marinistellae TaxID=1739787 RepID=UPI00083706FC|nr:nitrogen fixation protein NifX [Tropicimonas marinistellae]